MRPARVLRGLAVGLAVLGFCLLQPLLAAGRADAKPAIMDVELQHGPDGNILLGQVVDPQGRPKADIAVLLRGSGRQVMAARTDSKGRFAFRGLGGGLYQLVAAGGQAVCRVWMPGTAPPSAGQQALVVAGQDTVRGQLGLFGGQLAQWLTNPWVIAGVVAAAVAIPVAIHNADKGPASP